MPGAIARLPGDLLRVDWRAWLADAVRREVENRRLFAWIAVAYGLGIVLAFAADGPLSPAPPLMAGMASAASAFAMRQRYPAFVALVALTAVFFGFAAATLRMQRAAAPVLQRMTVDRLQGYIETVEERGAGARLVIVKPRLAKLAEAETPSRVRVTVRALSGLAPGDHVAGTARLLPPPEAARPGGYDFARDAYFRGIGAVGSVSGRLSRAEPPDAGPGLALRFAAAVDRARNALTTRIANTIGGQAGAVSAALITGKRGLTDERTNDNLRAAGIYHIVSISGLHMVLAAGTFFWLTRALLALSPALALRLPIKKIAALVGMLGATAYCVFSGSDVATERSLLMILVMQGAILFDRPALSLRNLAISALLVLSLEPEAILGPSFQMSYAAVAALIAFAEWERRRGGATEEPVDPIGRILLYGRRTLVGVVGTTLVATLATGPFGSYHFQTLQPYGLIGNAVTLPLVSFAVMPAAVGGVLAYPFGLDRPVWTMMGWATEGVLWLSARIAEWPSSTLVVPAFGAATLVLLVVAILLVTLPASGLRWLALAPACLALPLAAAASRPDIYLARDGSGAAIRGPDARLTIVGRVAGFTVEQWLKADGDPRRSADPTLRKAARCDALGCTVTMREGGVASYVIDRRAFREDCGRAALVLSGLSAPTDCAAARYDRGFLSVHGATTLSRAASGWTVASVRTADDTRPWIVKPSARGGTAPVASRDETSSDKSSSGPVPVPSTPAPVQPRRDEPDIPLDPAPDDDPAQ